MANYLSMTKEKLAVEFETVKHEFEKIKGAKLSLDMSRKARSRSARSFRRAFRPRVSKDGL